MKKISTALLSLLFLVHATSLAIAQGCSDSGFCSMGAFRPDQHYVQKLSVRLNSVELTQHLGHSRQGDWIHSTFLDASIAIGKRTSVQCRLPAYTIIVGNMPSTKGWGDVFFNVTHSVLVRDHYQVNVTAGAKMYTSVPDKSSSNGDQMPLYQQTTYGSNDLSVGASLLSRGWLLAVGYQRALNVVRNKFSPEAWQGDPLYEVVKQYDPSNGLRRGNDVMFRVERNFRLARYNFYGGFLNLWRVTRDRIVDENGAVSVVEGSDGLAVNFITGGGYQFNAQMGIRVLVSFNLKERDANPDGLSRDFISQLAYIVRF